MRILVAEDDRELAKYVQRALVDGGHAVDVAYDGESAWLMAEDASYDLLILDIMMPGLSGLDVLREFRKRGGSTPVLLLTARDGLSDRVTGLDLGADDFMSKPFALAELLARVRALGRRKDSLESPELACGDLTVDLPTHQVRRGGREVVLTAKEFSLLHYLLAHQGTVVTRADIMEKIWDMNLDMFSDVVKVMVSRLRRKLEIGGSPPLIHTIRGVGYIMKESP